MKDVSVNKDKRSQIEACLKAHNVYRAKHGVPDLEICPNLCEKSQKVADDFIANKRSNRSQTDNYGENIFAVESSDPNYVINGNEAVDSWYSGNKYYKFEQPGFSQKTGHFTQLVWKNSKKLGVGIAKVGGKTVVACLYDPPGNFEKDYPKNVFPPGSGHHERDVSDCTILLSKLYMLFLAYTFVC